MRNWWRFTQSTDLTRHRMIKLIIYIYIYIFLINKLKGHFGTWVAVQKEVTKINVKCGVDESGLVGGGDHREINELMCFLAFGQSDKWLVKQNKMLEVLLFESSCQAKSLKKFMIYHLYNSIDFYN